MTEAATDIQATDVGTSEVDTAVSTADVGNDVGTEAPSFAVPADYAESPWAKGLDTQEAVWKKLAGSQKLIGDRGAFIPQEGATTEEVDAFLSKLDPFNEQLKGKFSPQAPEAYEFSALDLPEGATVDDSITAKFSDIAKAHGLSNDQADNVRKEWIAHELEQESNRDAKLNEEFETMAKGKWGDDWATVTAEASEVLKGHVPEEMREAMMGMPNQYLIPLVSVMQSMKAKPDGLPNTSGTQVMTPADARVKYNELRQAAQRDPREAKAFQEFNEKHRHLVSQR